MTDYPADRGLSGTADGRPGRYVTTLLRTATWICAGLCLLPIVAVVLAALFGGTDTIKMLADTVLWRYTYRTLLLVGLVGTGTVLIGTGAAWLVTMTRFPGVRFFEIALALPLGMRIDQ